MARTHSHRRHTRTHHRATERAGGIQWSLLLISFFVGAALDWVRHQPYSFTWDWRMETGAILIAAWIGVVLGARWPGFDYAVARVTGLLLLALFLGSVALHALLAHP